MEVSSGSSEDEELEMAAFVFPVPNTEESIMSMRLGPEISFEKGWKRMNMGCFWTETELFCRCRTAFGVVER